MEQPPASWRSRLRRWRWWIAALALIILVRALLPVVLRRVMASHASEALHARVDVGNVDLALWKGGVALEDVAVRPADAPPLPDEPLPENAPAFSDHAPLIGFKRLAVELRYWPLFSKTIQLRDIELVAPRVALDRLADGDLNLMALVPKSDVAVAAGATPGGEGTPAATPTATPASAVEHPASPWKLGLDRFVLRDGRLRFRDLKLEGSEPVEVGIDEVSVQEIALSPGVYGEPAHLHVKVAVDEGTIDVASQLRLLEHGYDISVDVNADSLPLRRARLYIPKVGWSDLKGELDLALTYELQTDTKNALHGTFGLRDVAIAIPDIGDVAAWKSLAVDIEGVDLLAQRAAVSAVTLDGLLLFVRAGGGQPLPVLAKLSAGATPAAAESPTAAEDATPAAAESPTPTPAAGPPPAAEESPTPAEAAKPDREPTPPAKPWDWSVASVRVGDSTVRVLSDQPPLDVGVDLTGTNLASAPDAVAHLALALGLGEATLKVDGDVAIAKPAFGGTINIAALALPPLVAVTGAVAPSVLPSATFRADLAVQAGLPAKSGATAEPDLLRVTGTLGLGDVRVSPPGQSELTIEAKGFELNLGELAVPGVVPIGQRAAPEAALRVAADLKLDEPRVTRTGEQPLSFAAQSVGLSLSDVSVAAGLAKLGPTDAPQSVHAVAKLDIAAPQVALPSAQLAVEAGAVSLAVSNATLSGVPPDGDGGSAAPEAALRVAADLGLQEPRVTRTGEQPLSFAAQSVALNLSDVSVPASLANLGPADAPQPLHGVAKLDLAAPQVALPSAQLAAGARTVSLAVSNATLTVVPRGGDARTVPPAQFALQLDLTEPKATIAEGQQLAADAQAIGLQVADLTLPGLVLGPAPSDTGQPLHTVATLTMTQPRAVRGDGKEFSVAAKSIALPVTDLSLFGVLPPAADAAPAAIGTQPLRAAVGDVRIDAPAIRLTRTKDGIVLPMSGPPPPPASAPAPRSQPTPLAAPASAPASPPATPPIELTLNALRISTGTLDFTDRAVKPPFQTRYAPIEIEARNVRYPNPSVKPLHIEITSSEQGKIVMTGDFGPQGGTLDLKMNDFALAPFNPYATAYSPYRISDGALEIKTTAKFSGGKYDVRNAITLHQLDLSGAEGDSVFEEQFGVPLTMALALLRDASGDIDLNIPMQVDQSGGATVDVITVVRSALRQALLGAIESPLKLVGGVIGMGGKSGAIAPAPIAFPLGRPQPTSAGAESADRLAAFLTSRPGMAVELDTAVTTDDVRWLREQALHAEWADEGVFKRSFAFVTQRGPRERIGDYLTARAEGNRADLSAEDAATLQHWLDERPPPSAEQLRALAAARVATVESVLHDKGIDQARITHGEVSDEPADGAPVVKIKFRPLQGRSDAKSGPPTTPEEGQ